MRTARLLPASPSMHCSRGVGTCPGGVPGPGGCTWSGGGGLGVPGAGGYLVLGGVPRLGVYLVPGVYLVSGGVPTQVLPSLWTEWQTPVKNITFANFVCGR